MSGAIMRPCAHCGGTGQVLESFAYRLKQAREVKGITQAKLSELIGVSRPQIANIEAGRGNASVPVLIGLSAELGVTVDWLLKGGDLSHDQ